ncbi:hypothetical protein O3Q52_52100 [Streptomyces sp. ActVer]|uniref:hypothetical protein n=1 Tax=Streptomyces sp. ActVer TaxID=3014558 RepID=UPI0022B5267B|nr:hypothetical protein [Streptomyces sp. ActVer]MCZ4516512.1 hypothetical protein [Streptomyces sp. ActVer]
MSGGVSNFGRIAFDDLRWEGRRYAVTNLQTAGAGLGSETPKRARFTSIDILPKQQVEEGAEPLLYAATSPEATAGAYYGPGGRFGLVGPTITARITRRALNTEANRRLWTEADLTAAVA